MFEKVFSKKRAITLGELLVVFTIMGVIASMTIISAKPTERSLKYAYSQAYNALGIAFYNSTTNMPKNLANDSNMDGSFPKTPKNFCLMLTEYINTSNNNCDSASSAININNSNINSSLNSTAPHFIASNGSWYWIGKINNNNFATITLKDSKDALKKVRYYVVIVDLNGSMKPNTAIWSQKTLADRVAFIVTEDAEVIPLGAAEYDPRYLTAKVVYESMTGVEMDDLNTSKSMTYYEAKRNAWAPSESSDPNNIHRIADELLSFTFYENAEGVVSGDTVSASSPFFVNYKSNTNIAKSAAANIDHDKNCEVDETFDPTACYVKITEYN